MQATERLVSHHVETGLFVVQEQHATLCHDLLRAVILMRTLSAKELSNASSILMRAEADNLRRALPVEKMKGGRREHETHLNRR